MKMCCAVSDEEKESERIHMLVTIPTRFLTVLSSPSCGTLASTKAVANSSILAFTIQLAVWPIYVIVAG